LLYFLEWENPAHIISVLDFGFANNTPYLVMEYAPYGTLRQRPFSVTRLSLEAIVSYVKQVAEALHYAISTS
jgi:serine/threonine protein kinase